MTSNTFDISASLIKGGLAFSVLLASPVQAQEVGTTEETKVLETVTVTARQAPENVKDLPFSVTVVSDDFLRERGLFRIEDAISTVPGVDINSNGSPTLSSVRIRGVGSLYLANRDDTSVSLILDGIPTATENIALSTLDVERVEILKGPQSNIYGQNSEAGAINITTKQPTDDFEAFLRGRIGEESQYVVEGILSGPLSDGVSARIAARQAGSDHWIENTTTGDPVTSLKDTTVLGQLKWEGNKTSVRLAGTYNEVDDQVSIQILRPYSDPPQYNVAPDRFEDNEKSFYRAALNINHEFSFGTLLSSTAYTTYDLFNELSFDIDLNQALFGFPVETVAEQSVEDETFSQELRLTSPSGSEIFWITGLSFYDTQRDNEQLDLSSLLLVENELKTTSYGLYGEATVPLSERLSLTGGARLSAVEKEYDGLYTFGGVSVPDARELDDTYFTGRAAVSYAVTDETNIYALYARGYKSGGFNEFSTQIADSVPFEAATVDTLEAGFKTTIPAYNLRLNGAVFFNNMKDDHVLGFDPFTFASNVLNADTESFGAEIDGIWNVAEGLTLTGGIVYLDTEITSDVLGVFGGDVFSGNAVPDAPEWSGAVSLDWQFPLQVSFGLNADFETAVTYRYEGERAADPQNNFDLNDYGKLDLNIGLANELGRLYFWADNLTDKEYDLYGFGFGFPGSETGAPARGRTVGVGFELNFN